MDPWPGPAQGLAQGRDWTDGSDKPDGSDGSDRSDGPDNWKELGDRTDGWIDGQTQNPDLCLSQDVGK